MSDLFWTEGTIAAIVVGKPIRFLLSLSSTSLIEMEEKKRVLFSPEGPDGGVTTSSTVRYRNAKIVKCIKNTAGKECLWFSQNNARPNGGETTYSPRFSAGLLLHAKNVRNTMRVGVSSAEFAQQNKGVSCRSPFVVSGLVVV